MYIHGDLKALKHGIMTMKLNSIWHIKIPLNFLIVSIFTYDIQSWRIYLLVTDFTCIKIKCERIVSFGKWIIVILIFFMHCSPKIKVQPTLLFSSFAHNSWINELKNVKLSEHICYDLINRILYYCDFVNE